MEVPSVVQKHDGWGHNQLHTFTWFTRGIARASDKWWSGNQCIVCIVKKKQKSKYTVAATARLSGLLPLDGALRQTPLFADCLQFSSLQPPNKCCGHVWNLQIHFFGGSNTLCFYTDTSSKCRQMFFQHLATAKVWPLNAKSSMPTKLALPVERPRCVDSRAPATPSAPKGKALQDCLKDFKGITSCLSGSIWSTFCTSQQSLLRTARTWGPMRELPKVLSGALRLKIPRPQGFGKCWETLHGIPMSVLLKTFEHLVFDCFCVQLFCKCLSNCQCGSKDIILQKSLKALTRFDSSSMQTVQTCHHNIL